MNGKFYGWTSGLEDGWTEARLDGRTFGGTECGGTDGG
jgi:hypothetical protein